MRVNLHTHSLKSDGVFTPADVVKQQADDKIEAVSLTDHDTVEGVDEAILAGERYGIKVIPGIELSSSSICEIHVLGYNFDYKNPEFVQKLADIKGLRVKRIKMTLERLRALGVPISDDAFDFETDTVGRVHVAKELVRIGEASNVGDAFYRYLGAGKSAYIGGYRLTPMEAVKTIKEFGGVAVLAHPVYIPKAKAELLISGLVNFGLDGIECYYSSHNETDTKRFVALADKYRLIKTAGTDLHDSNIFVSSCYDCTRLDERSLKRLGLIT